MKEAFLAYVPVYHRGFEILFAKFPQIDTFFLINSEELQSIFPIHKDLHALPATTMRQILASLSRFQRIVVANEQNIAEIRDYHLIVPRDEAVAWWLDQRHVPKKNIREDSVFLRWTRRNALQKKDVLPDKILTKDDQKWQKILRLAHDVGLESSDWWRQVGAVLLLADGTLLAAYNRHLPDAQTPMILGDIRGQFHRGEHWELGSSIHAEAAVLARAARCGLATLGARLVVTDFPCPNCAKLIAAAGISELYFNQGYTMIDGEDVLRAAGVKIYHLETNWAEQD